MDLEIEEEVRNREELTKRQCRNATLRTRLQEELTEKKLRGLFRENLPYLRGVQAGQVVSFRHQNFHKSTQKRHALRASMISEPFSDQQMDWTLDEIDKGLVKNLKKCSDLKDYIWKVLLPESFIKIYSDFFHLDMLEAEQRIRETSLTGNDAEDGPAMMPGMKKTIFNAMKSGTITAPTDFVFKFSSEDRKL